MKKHGRDWAAAAACLLLVGGLGTVSLFVGSFPLSLSQIGSILTGGALMLASSITAKLLSTGAMLPVGIITSLVGVPFLLFLLLRTRREGFS